MKKILACLTVLLLLGSLFTLGICAAESETVMDLGNLNATIEEQIIHSDVAHILQSVLQTAASVLAIEVVVGLIAIFFGYDITKYVMPGLMAVIGFLGVQCVNAALITFRNVQVYPWLIYLIGLVVGLIMLFITKDHFKFGVFMCGLVGGFLAATILLPKVWTGVGAWTLLGVSVAIGVVLGIVLQLGAIPAGLFMLATSIGGGYLLAQVTTLINIENFGKPLLYIVWAVAAIIGFIYQFRHCRKGYFYY